MCAQKWRSEPSIIQQLLDEPYRFQFFQAVRLLESWLEDRQKHSGNAIAELIRFPNSIALSFPASEIEALEPSPSLPKTEPDLAAAMASGELDHIALTPAFFGFLGSNGALPTHYSERIAEHMLYERDKGPKAFFDAFSNRAVALFYQAWRKYRLELKYESDAHDGFLPLLLALAGMGEKALQRRLYFEQGGVFDHTLGFYAAALRQRPASAAYIEQVLAEYFSLPIKIEQFIGGWYEIPSHQLTILGQDHIALGSNTLAGTRVWQRNLKMRIRIGPLKNREFERFLPGGKAAQALEDLLMLFTSYTLCYEVRLILAKEEIKPSCMAQAMSGQPRLGWDSFLCTQPSDRDRDDVRYEIHALQ